MDKFTLRQHVGDQQRIFMYGRQLVGFCGVGPGQPVCFLAGRKLDKLTLSEKADVIAFVREHVGKEKPTSQTRDAIDELDDRADSSGER